MGIVMRTEISVVVPLKDEAEGVGDFVDALKEHLNSLSVAYEVLLIDDGSEDGTWVRLIEMVRTEDCLRIFRLSRNFGKESAIRAGLDAARGKAVIVIDADFQDPPELIPQMVEKWRGGVQVVTAVRRDRAGDSWLKRSTSRWFYRAFNRIAERSIPENAGDFRLIDRKVVDAVLACPERNRFHKGLFNWVGFQTEFIEFDRPARTTGRSAWSYWKLWNYAMDAIIGFSSAPLKVWSYLGLIIASGAFAYGGYLIAITLAFGRDVPGYASLMVVMLFLGGLNLLTMGIIGQYLAQVFQEVKARPTYIVAETLASSDPGEVNSDEV